MTEEQPYQQENPEALREATTSYREKLLTQYSEIIANTTFDASTQALEDQLAYYEALGVKKGFQQFKQHATELMQSKLDALNHRNSKEILDTRASLPDVGTLDDEPMLEQPSLDTGIEEAKAFYGVISSSEDQAELPSDLQQALDI